MRSIKLDPIQTQQAYDFASETYQKYKAAEYARYNNTPLSHIIGKLGEMAAYTFLHQIGAPGVIENFTADDSRPDLVANGSAIEVKTWTVDNWYTMGRCVAPAQLPKLLGYQYIIWCTGPKPPPTPPATYTVTINGFSYPKDFEGLKPKLTGPAGHQKLNLQLTSFRHIDDFIKEIMVCG